MINGLMHSVLEYRSFVN